MARPKWLKTVGGIGLAAAAFLVQPVVTPLTRAEVKASSSQSAGEIKVPPGTLDAVTAILTRRSIRDYSQHPVPEELLRVLVEAGMAAPSAFNERSQEFIVINDRKVLDAIYNLNPKALQIKRAQVAILVCGNQDKEKFKGQGYWQLDGAVAAENILIAANALGLGAVWTAIYPYPERITAVKKLLNLPEAVIPLTIIPVGYPAEPKARENRFDPSRLHQNRW
jgi:nitroreductase|uniref:Nitroreductase family protein n=1 Tax=Desulfobacca acetoxidans TaxID=60893 RepID=A0A7C3UXT6_9BACT